MIMHDKTTGLVGKIGPWGSSKLYISTRKDIIPFFKMEVQKKPKVAFKNLMIQFQNEKLKMKEFGFEEKGNCHKYNLKTDGLNILVERSLLKVIDGFSNEIISEKNTINVEITEPDGALISKSVFSDEMINTFLDVLKHEGTDLFPLFNNVLRDEIFFKGEKK